MRFEEVDAGQLQLAHFGRHFERQLPRDPGEAAVAAQLRFDLARGQADAADGRERFRAPRACLVMACGSA